MCSVGKGVHRNSSKSTGKHRCQSLFFSKVAGFSPATLLKNRLWHRYFPVNFAKFLRTTFFQNTSGRLLLKVKYEECCLRTPCTWWFYLTSTCAKGSYDNYISINWIWGSQQCFLATKCSIVSNSQPSYQNHKHMLLMEICHYLGDFCWGSQICFF